MKPIPALMLVLLALSATIAAPAAAQSAPFGVRPGMSLRELGKRVPLEPEGGHWYVSSTAPAPDAGFTEYRYLVTPRHGLCKVVAYAVGIPADPQGRAVQAKYEALSATVVERFGEPSKHDALRDSSTWRRPEDWMKALSLGDRLLASTWEPDPGKPGAQVESIQIRALSDDPRVGHVFASYELRGAGKCYEWLEAEGKASR